MATGFERDVERSPDGPLTCLPKRQDFRVCFAWAVMKTAPDNTAMLYHYGADHGIGAGRSLALCRKAKGQGHVLQIFRAAGHRFLRVTRDRLRLARAGFVVFACDDEERLDDFLASASANAAWAAASRAMGTRYGEQLT